MTTPSNQAAPASAAGYDTNLLNHHATKVLIQETATRRYLTVAGVWTVQPELAMAFRSGSSATEHMTRNKLTNVRLVLTRTTTVSEGSPTNGVVRA